MNTPTHRDSHPDDLDDAFARRLRSRLDADVWDLPEAGGPAAAVSRARTRHRNRRAVLASAAVFAVVAASSQAFTGDPGEADLATAPEGIVVDESLTFDWTTTNDGLSMVSSHAAGDAGLYALSTAAGTRDEDYPDGDAPRAMYRLTEEGSWTPIPFEGEDPNVGAVSERAGTLYALSTGTATISDPARPVGSISTDGGQSWASVPLEEATPPSDDVAWTVHYTLDITSTSEHTLAIVSAVIGLPYEDLFPELYDENSDGEFHTQITDAGVDLVRADGDAQGDERRLAEEAGADGGTIAPSPDPEASAADGDVVRTVTWSDLGVNGPQDLVSQRRAYLADGDDWRPVDAPIEGGASGGIVQVDAVSDAFLLTVTDFAPVDQASHAAYRSLDGQDWVPVGVPTSTDGSGELLAGEDALLHLGYGPDGQELQVSRDLGATWVPLDLRSLDPALSGFSDQHFVIGGAGPLGVALMIAEPEQDSRRFLLFSKDLERWSVSNLAEIVPNRAYFERPLVGTDRIVLPGHTGDGEKGSPERTITLSGVPRRT